MRIATFNVNSIKARLPFLLHWLRARQPDVACLQELKLSEDNFPRSTLEDAGYHAYIHGQASWNGVAVLSKRPGQVLERGLPGADDAGARLITVEVGGLSVTSVYVPNGKTVTHADFEVKLAWLHALGRYLGSSIGNRERAVIGGDFNVAYQDLDSWDPERLAGSIFHTEAERGALAEILGVGFTDLYRRANPEGRAYSWWDYRRGCFHKNEGLRIDLLLATAPLAEQVREVVIDREYRKKKDGEIPSDHAPVIAELAG